MTEIITAKPIEELVLEISDEQIIAPSLPIIVTLEKTGILRPNALKDKEVFLAKESSKDKINKWPPKAKFYKTNNRYELLFWICFN